MCIAILKKKNKQISKKTLERCFDSNPDGAGFMFAENGKLNVFKGYMAFAEFWDVYNGIKTSDKNVLIHFRIKTHGAISVENCHPFLVSNELGFIHNGVIDIKTKGTESDTMSFNRMYLKMIKDLHLAIKQNGIQKLIQDRINNSKLIFLDRFSNYTIINENAGQWHKGSWFSNSSFKGSKSCQIQTFSFDSDYYNDYDEKCLNCQNFLFEDQEFDSGYCFACLETNEQTYNKIKNNSWRYFN